MDLLSPSAALDFQERTAPNLDTTGTQLGLAPDEMDQLVRQLSGLQLSPAEQGTQQAAIFKALPGLLGAQTDAGQLLINQQEADIKADLAAVQAREASVKESAEKRLQADFDTLDTREQLERFDLGLRELALSGGPGAERAFVMLKGISSDPELGGLIREFMSGLIANGDFEAAGRFLGLSPEDVKTNFFTGGVTLKPGVTREALQPGGFHPVDEGPSFADEAVELLRRLDPEQFK